MHKILIIEDDPFFKTLITKWFEESVGLEIVHAKDFMNALAQIAQYDFDLFLIDFYLDSGANGFHILEALKNKGVKLYNRVIMLSDQSDKEVIIKAYEYGISNFLIKPIHPKILRAVVQKNLRMLDDKIEKYIFELDLEFDLEKHQVLEISPNDRKNLNLTPIEYKILLRLILSKEKVLSKDDLSVLGADYNNSISYKSLEMHIGNLRKKSETIKNALLTQRGFGYIWSPKVRKKAG